MRPLTNVLPKEILPTPDGPIIEIVVRELINSGIENVILVTSPGKEIIQQHLASIALPKTPSGQTTQLDFILQGNRPGNGGAILTAAKHLGDEPFIVVWGDELFIGDCPRAQELINIYEAWREPIIALTKIPMEATSKCGVANISSEIENGLFKLSGIAEKPDPRFAPSNLASVGGYVVTSAILDLLKKTRPSQDGEIYLSKALDEYANKYGLLGKLIDCEWHETGSMSGYVAAFTAIAKRNPNLEVYYS